MGRSTAPGFRDLRLVAFALLGALLLLAAAITYLAPRAEAQTAPPSTDLSVVIQEAADPLEPGAQTSVVVRITNSGPSASTGSTLILLVDPEAAGATLNPSSLCELDRWAGLCELGALASGEQREVTIAFTAPAAGMLLTAASIDAKEVDPQASNDTWTEDTTIEEPPIVLTPTDDAFVKATSKNRNWGHLATLEVDAEPRKPILLKFDLSGIPVPVGSAVLRLYGLEGSPDGGSIYSASHSDWSEATVTYKTRPRWGDAPIATIGPATAGAWHEVDVTSLTQAAGPVTIYILSASPDSADYSSKEGTHPPQLVISAAG